MCVLLHMGTKHRVSSYSFAYGTTKDYGHTIYNAR